MANELCPKCGSEMVIPRYGNHWEPPIYTCSLDPKDCRIKELEKEKDRFVFNERGYSIEIDRLQKQVIEPLERQLPGWL